MSSFGFTGAVDSLLDLDRTAALATLTRLIGNDMAYGTECMPAGEAEAFATAFLLGHEAESSRYLSNGRWAEGTTSWSPMTDSTFDGGLIVTRDAPPAVACLWFEDED